MPPEVGYWPLVVASVAQVVASVQNVRTVLVKNQLTYPLLGSALLTACLISADIGVPTIGGGLQSLIFGVGLSFLLVFFANVGAGVVKMQMAWGAWIGCAFESATTVNMVGLCNLLGIAFSYFGHRVWGYYWVPEKSREFTPVQPAFAVACIAVPLGYLLLL